MRMASLVWTGCVAFLALVSGCKSEKPAGHSFAVTGFNPIANFQPGTELKSISFDYENAIDSGFVIPSANQTDAGTFSFTFNIANNGKDSAVFYYKIYYQNESYKYPDLNERGKVHGYSHENFYGSWADSSISFKSTRRLPNDKYAYKISDHFRIVGNPRNERTFFSITRPEKPISAYELDSNMRRIRSDSLWMQDITKKAARNNITVAGQIELDAIFVINEDRKSRIYNNRWKRNPRTGTYSFLLVVTTEEGLKHIPGYVKNIGEQLNGRFVSPYSFFEATPPGDLPGTHIISGTSRLAVKASVDLARGIFINSHQLENYEIDYSRDCMDLNCNAGSELFQTASFQQFFHHIKDEMTFKNIPVTEDLQSASFSPGSYREYLASYSDANMVSASISNSDCPCHDVGVNDSAGFIELANPPARQGAWNKTNVGFATRHGFTYGRYTAKVRFPELLNESNMWNGLTNALWMINESNKKWNSLRACENKGYIPKHLLGKEAPRVSTTSYSEIDIEIRKASADWPETSYNKPHKKPPKSTSDSNKIIVTCTNWDLACPSPEDFGAGTQYSYHGDSKYLFHRWDHWYQAITTKHKVADDELFKRDYYFFQIDWRPDTIIWRMGPEKDQLTEIAFLDNTLSAIPNNQMLMVFTQEYHPSAWWPESPQLLEYIPFANKAIKGRLLELTID